jgi:minichromosome maintenance protein 10
MSNDDEEIALLEKMLMEEVDESEKKKEETQKFFADSSDEESKEVGSKYTSFGQDISKKLKETEETRKYNAIRLTNDNQPSTSSSFRSAGSSAPVQRFSDPTILQPKEIVFCDPIFGLRIVNPVISSVSLKERMQDKFPVGVQRVRFHTERGDLSKDWVIAAIIVSKSPIKNTQKGDPFSIWTLSDLKGEIKMCTLFLFRSAHKELWKTNVGTVIAILNPKALERKDEKVEAVLSVDNNQRVMILGQSKDLGTCRAKKNNGDPCCAIVNKTDCDHCIFHMKKEYGKIQRSELSVSGLGRGLQELRNKVLGKSEVFYAGQSFSATKAQKPVKQMKKDRERLMTLSEYFTSPYNPDATPTTSASPSSSSISQARSSSQPSPASSSNGLIKRAASIDPNSSQRRKDLERLKLLQGTETPTFLLTPKFERENQPKTLAVAPPPKKDPNFVPKLSSENLTFSFSMPQSSVKKNEIAKQKAAALLKKKPLETTNPNLVKYRGTEAGKKRIADELNSSIEEEKNDSKKVKLNEEEELQKRKEYLQKIMNAKSSHDSLVEDIQREKEQKTFDRLEKKEAMEERMANTMELKVIF